MAVNRRWLAATLCLGLLAVSVQAADPSPGRAVSGARKRAPLRTDRYGDPLPDGAVARLGTLRFRGVSAFVLAPDGKTYAHDLLHDGVRICDARTGKVLRTLPRQTSPVEWPVLSDNDRTCGTGPWSPLPGTPAASP